MDTPSYVNAGSKLLAQQPTLSKGTPVNNTMDLAEWRILGSHCERRMSSLRTWRQSWWSQNWSDLAQYLDPKRSTWLTQSTGGLPSPNNMSRGKAINSSILDPTGTWAMRVCSSGIMSGLASPSRPWFKIVPATTTQQPDDDGRRWIDEVEKRMYTAIAGSNFYNSFSQECEDVVGFGTMPDIIYEDPEDIFRVYVPAVGEYFLGAGSTGRVDTFGRLFVMTTSQIVEFFEIKNCPKIIQDAWKGKGEQLNKEFIVAHLIEPNFALDEHGNGKIPGKFTWREVYWLWGNRGKLPLSVAGFIEQPFSAARWSTQSNDAYGRSVGMDVLPDIKQLQVETFRKAEAIEKVNRPPLLADAQLKNQPASSLPGHVTYVNNLQQTSGMRPIFQVNPDINAITADIKDIQNRIKVGFFADLFLMLQNPPTNETAYSVAQRIQEKMQVLGPVIENIITDGLKPKLRRIFSIMQRKKLFPPMPESMRGIPLDIQFVSMLALAQRAAATGSLERLASITGNLGAAFPDVKDNFNADEYIRIMSDLLGTPQSVLNSTETVSKLRAARAEQMKQMQQQQQMSQGISDMRNGADAAKVLADTDVGGGQKALQSLIGQ